MTDIKHPGPEGQVPSSSSPFSPDPAVAHAWLRGLRAALADAQGASEDQLRPRRQRRLGHLEAERILGEAFLSLDKALSFAERALPPAPDAP